MTVSGVRHLFGHLGPELGDAMSKHFGKATATEAGDKFTLEAQGDVDLVNSLFSLHFPKSMHGTIQDNLITFDKGSEPTMADGDKVKQIRLVGDTVEFKTDALFFDVKKAKVSEFCNAMGEKLLTNDGQTKFLDQLSSNLDPELATAINFYFTDKVNSYEYIQKGEDIHFKLDLNKPQVYPVKVVTPMGDTAVKIVIPNKLEGVIKKGFIQFNSDKTIEVKWGISIGLVSMTIDDQNLVHFKIPLPLELPPVPVDDVVNNLTYIFGELQLKP